MTVQQLIDYALQDIAVIDPGETPSTSERTTAFDILNQLLSSWSAQAAPIPQLTVETIALTGAASYTLPTRPIKLKAASVLITATMSVPVEVRDAAGFASFADKAATVPFPRVAWYEEGYPTGKIHIAPTPTVGGTIEIHSDKGVGAGVIGVRDSFGLTAGVGEYTIGVGGTFSTERPIRVTAVSVRASAAVSQPAEIMSADRWAKFSDKSVGGQFIDAIFYDGSFSSPKIYVAPRPSTGTLELISYRALTAFGAQADVISLAPGYERALRATLAIELAGSYGVGVPASLQQAADDARASIFGLNQAVLGSVGEPPVDQKPAPVIVAK